MGFGSAIGVKEPVIGDEFHPAIECRDPVTGQWLFGRGLDLGLRGPSDHEYGDVATAFPSALLVPRNEWQARIEQTERTQSRLSDLCTLAGLPHKDQASTNYCWANAPVYAMEVMRVKQNQPMVILSPASVAAPIKGYRNVGGWGKEALEWIVQYGAAPVSLWPANGINKSFATKTTIAEAAKYRVDEWCELVPRNIEQLVSMLLHRIPVPVGYNWWGHEVTAIDAVWLDGTVAIRIRNSWANWGDNGYGILQGNRMLPDDAVAPFTTLAV